jgi:hypothetical protein
MVCWVLFLIDFGVEREREFADKNRCYGRHRGCGLEYHDAEYLCLSVHADADDQDVSRWHRGNRICEGLCV